jgi:hypothetical protein
VPKLWITFGEILSCLKPEFTGNVSPIIPVTSWRPGQLPGWPFPQSRPVFNKESVTMRRIMKDGTSVFVPW